MGDCHFKRYKGECAVLTVGKCTEPETCSFYKTTEQYYQEQDAAIEKCREKGLCHRCAYSYGKPCKLSTEPKFAEVAE